MSALAGMVKNFCDDTNDQFNSPFFPVIDISINMEKDDYTW